MRRDALGAAVLWLLLALSYSLTFELHAGYTQCIFQQVSAGQRVKTSFTLAEKSQADLEIELFKPSGDVLFHGDNRDQGLYEFKAQDNGLYKMCVKSLLRTRLRRQVDFRLEVDSEEKMRNLPVTADVTELGHHIDEVAALLLEVEHSQERYNQAQRQHVASEPPINHQMYSSRAVAETSHLFKHIRHVVVNSMWTWTKQWTALQCLAVAVAVSLHVLFLQRLFLRRVDKRFPV